MKKFVVWLTVMVIVVFGATVNYGHAVTLTYWNPDKAFESAFHTVVERFQKKYPDIKVEIEWFPWKDLPDKLVITMQAGVGGPDVSVSAFPWTVGFASMGGLAQLDDYLDEWGQRDDFFEEPMTLTQWRGGTYSLPMGCDTMPLGYRTDLLEKAGIGGPPTTWWELMADALKLTQDTDGDGKTDVWGFSPFGDVPILWHVWTCFLWQQDVPILKGTLEEGYTVGFDNPRGVEVMQFLSDFQLRYKINPPGTVGQDFWDTLRLWKMGKLAMLIMQPAWADETKRERPDLPFATAVLPKGRKLAGKMGGRSLVILAASKHKEEAWKFIQFHEEFDSGYILGSGMMPIRKSHIEHPAYKKFLKENPIFKGHVEMVSISKVYPRIPEFEAISRAVVTNIQKMWMGTYTAEQANKALADEVTKLISR